MGAARVYAYDVGHSQLDWRIRSDPRVFVKEGVNARHLRRADFPEPISLCVIDVSFISLTKILPAAFDVLGDSPTAEMVALIKPQFESRREDVGKGGIVKDPEVHRRAVESVKNFVATHAPGLALGGRDGIPDPGHGGQQGIPLLPGACRVLGETPEVVYEVRLEPIWVSHLAREKTEMGKDSGSARWNAPGGRVPPLSGAHYFPQFR